jgi:uncharacterized surface protein with fasciclin (FAS1) repeats
MARRALALKIHDRKMMKHLTLLTLSSALFFGCGGSSSTEASMDHSAGDEAEMTESMEGEMDEMAASDIVDTAIAAGSFSTLIAAVQAAGLEDTLRSDGPFTVFAPTDDAFAALPEGTVENLLLPENRDLLAAILTYHVVSGDVRAVQAMTLTEAPSVEGSMIPIAANDGGLTVGGANVIQADIEASNGVIHVIDAVIMPPSL